MVVVVVFKRKMEEVLMFLEEREIENVVWYGEWREWRV